MLHAHAQRENYSNGAVISAKTGCVLSSANVRTDKSRRKNAHNYADGGPEHCHLYKYEQIFAGQLFCCYLLTMSTNMSPAPLKVDTAPRLARPWIEKHKAQARPERFFELHTQRCLGSDSNSFLFDIEFKTLPARALVPILPPASVDQRFDSHLPFDYFFAPLSLFVFVCARNAVLAVL